MADANKWITEAANAVETLIKTGSHKLYTSSDLAHAYNNIFRMTDLSGVSEVIYWRKYATGVEVNHFLSYYAGYNGGATKDMVEDYICTDGLPISLSNLYKGDAVYEDIFANRDPRLRQTILYPEGSTLLSLRKPRLPGIYLSENQGNFRRTKLCNGLSHNQKL